MLQEYMEITRDKFGTQTINGHPEIFLRIPENTPPDEVVDQIIKYKEDSKLCQQLLTILIKHAGETGENEGAVACLERISSNAKMLIGKLEEMQALEKLLEQYEKSNAKYLKENVELTEKLAACDC